MPKFFIDDYTSIFIEQGEDLKEEELQVVRGEESFDFHLTCNLIRLKVPLKHCSSIQVRVGEETYPAVPRFITHTPEFEKAHPYDIHRLGAHYSPSETVFSCYAPTHARLFLVLDGERMEMVKTRSTFSLTVPGDLEGHRYHYEREDGLTFTDPFSYNDTYDGNNSFILDPAKLRVPAIRPKPRKNLYDLCLYETSVRDFSSDPAAPFAHPGTFLAFTESGLTLEGKSVGLDYLKEIGVSHVQLMPVFRFDKGGFDYNWGYNPVSYATLHPEYGVGRGPYDLVREFRRMVDTLHQNNIRVTLDVVFNHVFDAETNVLGRMIPYYCFRYRTDGRPANGSYCGNEVRTQADFVRDLILEMCRRYITLFDIDGLRFDLMGLMDIQTISAIRDSCRTLKPDFLIYGEGWNMGDVMPEIFRCHMGNADKLPGVAFFNSFFRDTLRGSNSDIHHKGYLEDNHALRKNVKMALAGSYGIGLNPAQSVNYIECHDNLTMHDKFLLSTPGLDEETLMEKVRMSLGLVTLSRGFPFLHSGQEFMRTKQMIDNSYNLDDSINRLDWSRRVKYDSLCQSLAALLRVRREHPVFTDETLPVSFIDYYEVLIYCLGDYKIFINPCIFDHIYQDDQSYELIYDGKALGGGKQKAISIPHYRVVVARKLPAQESIVSE